MKKTDRLFNNKLKKCLDLVKKNICIWQETKFCFETFRTICINIQPERKFFIQNLLNQYILSLFLNFYKQCEALKKIICTYNKYYKYDCDIKSCDNKRVNEILKEYRSIRNKIMAHIDFNPPGDTLKSYSTLLEDSDVINSLCMKYYKLIGEDIIIDHKQFEEGFNQYMQQEYEIFKQQWINFCQIEP